MLALRRHRATRKCLLQLDNLLALKAERVKESNALPRVQQRMACRRCMPLCVPLKLTMRFIRLRIDPRNRRAGQNIMELMQEQLLPEPLGFLLRIGSPLQRRQRTPKLHIMQSKFTAAVVVFDFRLRGIRSAVGVEIQLAVPCMRGRAFFLQIRKEIQRRHHLYPRHALQIALTNRILDKIAARSAAAVAVPERHHEFIQMTLLRTGSPCAAKLLRIRSICITGRQEGRDRRTVHAFPCKVMIREWVAFVVAPEYLLRHQILYAAVAQQLRQNRRIAKRIRQPEHAALHAELLPVKSLAVDQLTHQCLAGGHIGIRLNIHRAFRNPASVLCRHADALVQLRIMLPAHFIGGRLALNKAVLRITFQQSELRGKGACRLSVGFLHGPEPRQIQMRIADRCHQRRSRTVAALHQRAQAFPRPSVIRIARLRRLLKIDYARVFLQPVGNL